MSDQTQVNHKRSNGRPAAAVRRSMSGIARDVLSLAELQGRLLAIDLDEVRSRSIWPVCALAVGVIVGFGTVPTALMAVAYVLVELFGLSEMEGFLIAALLGIAASAVLLLIAYSRLKNALEPLLRSRDELQKNVHWVKHALSAGERDCS